MPPVPPKAPPAAQAKPAAPAQPDPDQAPPGDSRAALTAPLPPHGLLIDAAQVGGSSRGGEWNTAPHPGSPASDRQAEKKT